MSVITMRSLVDGLNTITIAGVTRKYLSGSPAGAVSTGDLPASFIHLPTLNGSKLVFKGQGGKGGFSAQYIILTEPVAQNKQSVNWDAAVDMADALEGELFDAACSIGGVLGWNIRIGEFLLAGQAYWAVIAVITGAGRFAP